MNHRRNNILRDTMTPSRRFSTARALLIVLAAACATHSTPTGEPDAAGARVVLQTSAGNIVLALFPDVAPRTVRQFVRLARAGVFDTTYFYSIAPGFLLQASWAFDRGRPISQAQRALIEKIPLEASAIKHERGVLSMTRDDQADPDSAATSYAIMLGEAPQLDGKYTVFGRVESGFEVMARIEGLGTTEPTRPRERIEIARAVVVADPAEASKIPPLAREMPPASRVSSVAETGAEPESRLEPAAEASESTAEAEETAPSCHPAEQNARVETAAAAPKPEMGGMAPPDTSPQQRDKPISIDDSVDRDGERVRTVIFKQLYIDRLYPSMRGPWTQKAFKLSPESPRVWLTGYRAEVLDGESGRGSQEFMCHTNLDLAGTPEAPPELRRTWSQLSISQGQTELRFPKGYALRLENDPNRQINLSAMVLNANYPDLKKSFDFKSTIHYLDDDAARRQQLKPLFQASVYTVCPIEPSVDPADTTPPCEPATSWEVHAGPYKRRQTGHWIVPPGRQEITHDVTGQLALPYDTTVHYIWMHLHPYGERMELRDRTTGQVVWQGRARTHPTKAILLATDSYSSTQGIPLYKDHQYELTTVYDNRSGKRVTAMAALWMYLKSRD